MIRLKTLLVEQTADIPVNTINAKIKYNAVKTSNKLEINTKIKKISDYIKNKLATLISEAMGTYIATSEQDLIDSIKNNKGGIAAKIYLNAMKLSLYNEIKDLPGFLKLAIKTSFLGNRNSFVSNIAADNFILKSVYNIYTKSILTTYLENSKIKQNSDINILQWSNSAEKYFNDREDKFINEIKSYIVNTIWPE